MMSDRAPERVGCREVGDGVSPFNRDQPSVVSRRPMTTMRWPHRQNRGPKPNTAKFRRRLTGESAHCHAPHRPCGPSAEPIWESEGPPARSRTAVIAPRTLGIASYLASRMTWGLAFIPCDVVFFCRHESSAPRATRTLDVTRLHAAWCALHCAQRTAFHAF